MKNKKTYIDQGLGNYLPVSFLLGLSEEHDKRVEFPGCSESEIFRNFACTISRLFQYNILFYLIGEKSWGINIGISMMVSEKKF